LSEIARVHVAGVQEGEEGEWQSLEVALLAVIYIIASKGAVSPSGSVGMVWGGSAPSPQFTSADSGF